MGVVGDATRWTSTARASGTIALAAVLLALFAAGCDASQPGGASGAPEPSPPPPAQTSGARAGAAAPPPAPAEPVAGEVSAVARVVDGDTIVLESGMTVRLVQIDAPEVRGAECYADEAAAALEALIPSGTPVRVEADASLDQVDRYGRTLAYVFKGAENVNLTLVAEGAASVWFYGGARGRYADVLLAAAEEAQAAGRGLWGACDAGLDPLSAVTTAPRGDSDATQPEPQAVPAAAVAAVAAAGDAPCHAAYEPCLPILADMNCPAVRALGKAPVTVRVQGVDPYHLDGDGNGIGCQ